MYNATWKETPEFVEPIIANWHKIINHDPTAVATLQFASSRMLKSGIMLTVDYGNFATSTDKHMTIHLTDPDFKPLYSIRPYDNTKASLEFMIDSALNYATSIIGCYISDDNS